MLEALNCFYQFSLRCIIKVALHVIARLLIQRLSFKAYILVRLSKRYKLLGQFIGTLHFPGIPGIDNLPGQIAYCFLWF